MVVLGTAPTGKLVGRPGLEAMIAAQLTVVVIVYVTLLVAMRRMRTVDAPGRLREALRAGVIRMAMTLGIIAVVAWRGFFEPAVFLVWAAIAYVIMILVETLALLHWSKRLEREG
jgi:hypothetical protein